MKDSSDVRQARAEMEAAKAQSEKNFGTEQKLPRRFRLYDKIKDNVSLRTVDWVIALTAFLIVALLVIGIVTAHPQ